VSDKVQQERPGDKPNKRPGSLHFLSPEERTVYNNLRRYGVSRDAAITAIIAEPKEKACS
jgi:hypothetical protein